jgi:peptidoglycan/xylan/chitin deacetylase (PgdA/CDA1 family)
VHRIHKAVGRSVLSVKGGRGAFAQRQGLTILGWHRIGAGDDGLATGPDDFAAHLECLRALDANILPMDEAVHGLETNRLPKRAVGLTFDDGYASVGTRAWPLLKERSVPATLFVVPGFMDPGKFFPWDVPSDETALMTSDDVVRLCADGLDIGSHSMLHRWLPGGGDGELLDDLKESKAVLENLLNKPVRGFAYPTGGWNRRVRRRTREAGYDYAITVDRGLVSPRRADLHSLRRTFVPDSVEDLEMLLDGGFDHLREFDRAKRNVQMRSRTKAGW